MKAKGKIVLASASPRRREFFGILGIPVELCPSDIAEVGYGGDPAKLPLWITRQKVKAVRSRLGAGFRGWIVGADTVVALGQRTFGKPRDAAEAKEMLNDLQGRTHQVYTGYQVEEWTGEVRTGTVGTDVTMAPLTEAQIDAYVATGECMDKAGGYAIQGQAGAFVTSISGSYSNVVGLPLHEVVTALRELGAIED
jgi:septum formation protein